MTRTPLCDIFSPLSDDQRSVLERFVRKVNELNESSFAKSATGLKGTMIPEGQVLGGQAWQITVDGPPEESIKAVVGDFRQLYAENSNSSAMKVVKILSERANARGTDASREVIGQLRAFRKELRTRGTVDPRGKMLEEDESGGTVQRSPQSIIATWLNGEYLHDDPEKAAELSPEGHASVEVLRFSLQTAVRDYIEYWSQLRDLAAAVLKDPARRSGS